ncbi:YfcC family protein [Streptococcus massiliensis]|uniref:Arginine-ornithine antiporter n=1 Tax=Streptococcus massiliensis TaxID=313439 RepID=A0A380KYN3_9STRE|nr:YfcC family protein [Streptococcus massiliensis]SUN76828.1 arginine-ornithine antiporter [Streptococcus massiliensis]
MKKGFKMPSSFTVLMIITALIALLTWIIPAGQFQADKDGHLIAGTYEAVKSNPQGIYDVFMAPIRAMLGTETVSKAIEVSFFIMMVGAFLGVVNETGALDAGIANVVKKYKGREKMLIPILMTLFALGGSTYGMGEETMAFYPLIVPVMMAVGFDNLVGVSIVLLGSQIGCLASTVNPFATGVASATAGVSLADGIIWRIISFIVITGLGIWFVYSYASKIQKDPTKSLTYANREADMDHFNVSKDEAAEAVELTKVQKKVLWVFALTFVLMIISLVPWADLGVPYFADFNTWLVGLPVIGQIVGTSTAALGTWYFPEVTMLFVLMAVIIGFVSRMGEERFLSAFMAGAADLLSVALVVAVARGIQVVMNDGHITATILHWGEEGLKGLSSQVFIILTYIFYLPMSFLIPSSSGLAGATMGIMAPLGEFAKVPAHLIITAYQSASGVLNLVTPTSGIVMGALALSRVDLGTWWKFVAKLIAAIVVATIIILVVATFF